MRNGIRASLIVFGAVGYMNEGRNARRFVPEMPFLNAVFFAEVVAVVTPQHDDRVVGVRASFECVQDTSDHSIGI